MNGALAVKINGSIFACADTALTTESPAGFKQSSPVMWPTIIFESNPVAFGDDTASVGTIVKGLVIIGWVTFIFSSFYRVEIKWQNFESSDAVNICTTWLIIWSFNIVQYKCNNINSCNMNHILWTHNFVWRHLDSMIRSLINHKISVYLWNCTI